MAIDQDELEVDTDEVIDEVETLEGEQPEVKAEEEEEIQVQIGEETPAQDDAKEAPDWVKELRKSHREAQKRIRELEAQQATRPATDAPKALVKPTLADSDYDEAKFEQAMDAYIAAKADESAKVKQAEEQQRKQLETIEQSRRQYLESAKALKVKDYQESEDEVVNALSEEQQGFLLRGATKKPELVVYALGKNQAKLRELAAIKDPVRFIAAAALLENDLKVTNRKTEKPMPETRVTGAAPAVRSDQQLERLRAEADKTGDRSKVARYLAQKR